MMNKVMAADDAANEKAFTGESGTASGMPSDGGESHEIQDVQVDAEPSLKAGDEVYCSQSVKEEALPGIAVDDDDDDEAGNISKLEEADSPKAEPVLLRMHDIDFAKEVQGTILSETHVLNCAEDFQGPILPEVHDINSANEVKGSVPPEMLDLNFASKVEDPILPEMHDINSSDKVESLIPPELHGMNSVNEVEGSFLPVTHDVNSVDEVDGPILPEMHDVNSADGYVGMSDTDIEVEINEVLSSNDGNILSKNSPFDHEDDRASCFDGEKLFLSCPESAGDIENGSDVDHAEFGDEDAAEVLENWAVQDDVFIDSETIIDSVPLTDTLPTSVKEGIRKPSVNIEKDNSDIYLTSETKCESEDAVKDESVRIEFSESNLPCADTIEAHAGFTKTCSSENLKFTEDAPNSKKNNSSKMEGDVSTSENFLPGMEYCRTDASVTAAEISEVKLDNSQEFLSEGSDLQMNSDCSLDGTTETKIQLALHNLDHPSSRDIHNSEKIASRVQYSTNVSKKRIDLGHQLVREIVKIQHDREQYERQCQVSKQESQNRWKLEKVDRVGKKDETELEKGMGREVLPQEAARNGMNGSFHRAVNEEGYMSMEKSVPAMRRGDVSQASQSGSKASRYFDKAESEYGKDRWAGKDLLSDEGMRVKDRQLSNRRHTFVDVQQEAVSKGGTRYDNSTPAHTGRDINHRQNTQGARRDRFVYDAPLSSRASNKLGSTKEAVQGQLLNTERVQPRTVGEAMNQGHLYSVTGETSHSDVRKLAVRGELQFQKVRLGTGKVFESRDQLVRKDDVALKASLRHSDKLQNKDQTLHSREEKMGRIGIDNQLRFGPVYRPPSARTPRLPISETPSPQQAQKPSPQQAQTPNPPTSQNETTYYFDELDAEVGSQENFQPGASTSRISLSNANPFQRKGTFEGRNASQVAGSPWKDASFENTESQSARVFFEKSDIHGTGTSNNADSTPPRWVNPQLGKEVPVMPVSKSNFDAGRQNRYIDSPMTNAIKLEAENIEKFVVNFDTQKQKRRIGYLNLNREDGAQKSLSNFSGASSGNGPSEQQEDLSKKSGYYHSGKQTGAKDLAGKVHSTNLVASGSSAQPYQSQAASGDEHPSNTTQKARLLGGSAKSKDRRHFSNNLREDTYSPKGAPTQDSVYSDIPDPSAFKSSLELSISGFRNKENATRIIEANNNYEVTGVATHDEFEESWSSPSFPINSLPKVKSAEGVSSKAWRWGDVVDEADEADEMEFGPLKMKAENNWSEKGLAEYGGRVDTITSSLPNAAQQQKNFVEHSHHMESRTVVKDAPNNIAILGQTSAKKSVWERLGPREAATDRLDKTKSAGDGLVMKPPYRSSNFDRSHTGNTSRGRQDTHFSEFNTFPINTGEAELVQTYKDEKQKRGKLELYVPRRSSHNF